MLSKRDHLKTRDTYRLKVKGWKKIFHANKDQRKAGVAILISDKIYFKIMAVKRDKEGHYIMIKGSVQEVQFSSVAQSCPTLCDPMNCRTPGLPVHHHLLEFTQTHVH